MAFIGNTATGAPLAEQQAEAAPTPTAAMPPAPSFLFLRLLLFVLALSAWGEGIRILPKATSVMHEILAYVCFLTGAVFLSAAALLEGLRVVAKRIR